MGDDDYSFGGSGGGKPTRKKGKAVEVEIQKVKQSDEEFPTDLPDGIKQAYFDLCERLGVVREVVNQGNQRVCWTIASSVSLSGHLVAAGRFDPPLRLSALHVLVGLIKEVNAKGGLQNLEHMRKFYMEEGTILEQDCKCPILALDMKNDRSKSNPVLCDKKVQVPRFKVADLVIIWKVDETEIMRLLHKGGSVAVGINAFATFSRFSGDGIYTGPEKGDTKVDSHLFTVVGFGTKMPEGIHYWKVQNSTGLKWGDKGFGKIIRKISRGRGQPSLFECVIYPKLLDHYEGQREQAA